MLCSIQISPSVNKIKQIKAYRAIVGVGLKDAKNAVDRALIGSQQVEVDLNLTEGQILYINTAFESEDLNMEIRKARVKPTHGGFWKYRRASDRNFNYVEIFSFYGEFLFRNQRNQAELERLEMMEAMHDNDFVWEKSTYHEFHQSDRW